jgi:hypothetical protein
MAKKKNETGKTGILVDRGTYVLLKNSNSVVLKFDTSEITIDNDVTGSTVHPKNMPDETIEFMPRGKTDDLPIDVIKAVYKNVTVGTNVDFKTRLTFGEGVQVLRRTRGDDGRIKVEEVLPSEEPDVFEWLQLNNYNKFIMEIISDLRLFYDSFVEFIFSNDGEKIVQVRAKETCLSRISKMDKDTGRIDWHGYCSDWRTKAESDTVATPLLDRDYPLWDLQQRMGKLANADGKKEMVKDRRFIQMLSVPSPGRFFYSMPYWYSVFRSGWFDFSNFIIDFKKSVLMNEMVPKHIVYIQDSYFDKLYKSENAVTPEDKKKVRAKFLKELDEFLAGKDNAGTSIVSEFAYSVDSARERKEIIIEEIDKEKKGGDYIEDSEESSNVLCYGMGVHSSILGNSPGKSKTINGTEARELFTIQQALAKYEQLLCVQPLYIVKQLNNWNKDLEFSIANLQLTTLDKNSGAVKQTGIKPDVQQPDKQ